jgi:hypothetical protein
MMASVGYDRTHSTLEIEFRTGHVYRYFAVPHRVFQALMKAESKGRFFHEQIDRIYPVEPIGSSQHR